MILVDIICYYKMKSLPLSLAALFCEGGGGGAVSKALRFSSFSSHILLGRGMR